jgi:Lrp/AsnC family leucine-responsive transcriptional regulator
VVTMVKLEKQTKTLLNEFEKTVSEMPEVQCCLHVSGKWDFMLHISAETPQDYYLFLMEKICGHENVEHAESAFVLRECKSFAPFGL